MRNTYYFKDEHHRELFWRFLEKAGRVNFLDREYEPFLYLLSAVGKPYLDEYIQTSGVLVGKLQETIKPFSHSEEAMIRAGINMFNSDLDEISVYKTFAHLDGDNVKAVIQAIKIRFLRE